MVAFWYTYQLPNVTHVKKKYGIQSLFIHNTPGRSFGIFQSQVSAFYPTILVQELIMNFQFHLFSIATEDPLSLNIRFVVQYHETCVHACKRMSPSVEFCGIR